MLAVSFDIRYFFSVAIRSSLRRHSNAFHFVAVCGGDRDCVVVVITVHGSRVHS